MRVVSGTCKGLGLKSVPGFSTRPTTDKVKEAIFNIAGPYFDGGLALDLFAGSGGLGIEALSRGVEKVIFVDRDGKAIQTINENLNKCGLEDRAEIYRNDAERAIKAIIKRNIQFHLIFLDPPYKKQQLENLLDKISNHNLLIKDGIIICEHSTDVELPDKLGNLVKSKYEKYGITAVSIYTYGLE